VAYLAREHGKHAPVLPVYSMVDRRRLLHREATERDAAWPVIPMASAIEQMSVRRAPVGTFAASSPAGKAFARLWTGVERKLLRVRGT
jgi:hypothetical protein